MQITCLRIETRKLFLLVTNLPDVDWTRCSPGACENSEISFGIMFAYDLTQAAREVRRGHGSGGAILDLVFINWIFTEY